MPDTETGTVTVRMLTSMAGDRFSYYPTELVPVAPDVAEAWVAAGIAELPSDHDTLEARVGDQGKTIARLTEERDALLADRSASTDRLEALAADRDRLTDEIAAAAADRASLDGELKLARSTISALTVERDQAQAELAATRAKLVSARRDLDLLRAAPAVATEATGAPDGGEAG